MTTSNSGNAATAGKRTNNTVWMSEKVETLVKVVKPTATFGGPTKAETP